MCDAVPTPLEEIGGSDFRCQCHFLHRHEEIMDARFRETHFHARVEHVVRSVRNTFRPAECERLQKVFRRHQRDGAVRTTEHSVKMESLSPTAPSNRW